jgi:hypothetical protein
MLNRPASSTKSNGFAAFVAVLFGVALFSCPAYAQQLRVDCDLVRQYDEAEVNMLLVGRFNDFERGRLGRGI